MLLLTKTLICFVLSMFFAENVLNAQITNSDFETGDLTGWTKTGTAFDYSPTQDDHGGLFGDWQNDWYVNTWFASEAATGTLRSDTFKLTGVIDFRIAGWNHEPEQPENHHNYIVLRLDSNDLELDRVWAPNQTSTMTRVSLEAPSYIGQNVYIEVVDDGSGTGYSWLSVDAFYMNDPAKASNPDPANKGLDYNDAVLSWTSGGGAVEHDVYLGIDLASVISADTDTIGVYRGRIGPNNYDTGGLTEEMTYYWRIDEVDSGDSVAKGDVWYFTVARPERDLTVTHGLRRTRWIECCPAMINAANLE